MYVYRNIEARSSNHRSSEEAHSITYFVPGSVALVIHHSQRMHRIT
jgi:hypothetical protein